MGKYDAIIAEAREALLNDPGKKKIDILLADMRKQELRNTQTDAGSLADLERKLLEMTDGKSVKSARGRALLRRAAVTLHKVRHEKLTDDDLAEICNRCAMPGQAKNQEELDKICETCPLRKVTV